jgi:hypothetical protein
LLGNISNDSPFAGADATNGEFSSSIKANRPAINPDFAPDESCLFDVFQLKRVPGSQQECPEGFGHADPDNCYPQFGPGGTWACPEGSHGVEDDETSQCYPDGVPCPDDMIMTEDDDRGCVEYRISCDANPNHPLCNGEERSDGIMVCDQPDHPGYKFCN